jgi:hypothetical protein
MARWEAFEIDPEFVHDEIDRGNVDYVEVASQVAETRFFEYLLSASPWENLVASFPSPRDKEEVPLWLYLASQLTLRLHGATGYGAYPYVIHCGGLKEVLGSEQVRWRKDPQTGRRRLDCRGYNAKNAYARITPCDPDFLRKLARDTKEAALQRWFGREVPRFVQKVGLWDDEGIVLVDGSYLFIPDNERYPNSAVLRFDEHNHPVDREKLSAAELERTRLRRCYRMVNAVHTNRREEYWAYLGLRMGSGKMAESPELGPMVDDIVAAVGQQRVKMVIHDRGFIDGPTVKRLKEAHGIDTLFPMKQDMLDWKDARRLAEIDGHPWQVWRPPAREPVPEPPQRPDWIRARERKRQAKVAEKRAEKRAKEPPPVKVDHVELKMIPAMRLWDSCDVPLQVTVMREYFTDGEVQTWGLGTTRTIEDPLEAWHLYQLRSGIEERHRQAKCFWDLTHFRACNYALVVNQVVFTLLAMTLMQVFLEKSDRGDLAARTRRRIWEELLPQGDKIVVYVKNRVAFLSATDYADWMLSVSEGARRRLRGRIRRLGRQRRDPPDLPPRP